MLDANRPVIEALRDALLERDELVGDEIEAVIGTAGRHGRPGSDHLAGWEEARQ
jgi:hypothetical protein